MSTTGSFSRWKKLTPEFSSTDVVLVVGANDVVNPAAKVDPSSPIYGMPILEVENAQHIIINKRSMAPPDYAGIDNELFYNEPQDLHVVSATLGRAHEAGQRTQDALI